MMSGWHWFDFRFTPLNWGLGFRVDALGLYRPKMKFMTPLALVVWFGPLNLDLRVKPRDWEYLLPKMKGSR